MLIFVVSSRQSAESSQRIFAAMSSEFYVERVGDRTCLLNPTSIGLAASTQAADLNSKLGHGVVSSFKGPVTIIAYLLLLFLIFDSKK